MFDAEVLVVGGGPAGSSVAFALATAGVDVLARRSRALSAPEALRRVSEPRGVAHSVRTWVRSTRSKQSGAAALAGIRVRAPNGAVIAGDFVGDASAFAAFAIAASRCAAKCSTRFSSTARAPPARRVVEGLRVTDVIATRPRSHRRSCTTLAQGRHGRHQRALRHRRRRTALDRRQAARSRARRCAGRDGSRSSRTTRTSATSASMARCTSSATATSASPTSATD